MQLNKKTEPKPNVYGSLLDQFVFLSFFHLMQYQP